jgi:O-antigen ligase
MAPIEGEAPPRAGFKILRALAIVPAWALFGLFGYRYVPLVGPFLAVLLPVWTAILIATAIRVETGILAFVLAFPLINNLPYFFGIRESIPHAPTALVLFWALFLGWTIRSGRGAERRNGYRPPPETIDWPLRLFFILAAVSSALTILRASDFWPLRSGGWHDLVINISGTRAGGAIMSTVFHFAQYAAAGFFFILLRRRIRTAAQVRSILRCLAASSCLALLFAVVQIIVSPNLGNTPFWVQFGQINGTFKDPNALAAFIAALVPLLLGLAWAETGVRRAAAAGSALFGVLIFPFSGSRSGFLALAVGLAAFVVPAFLSRSRIRMASKRKPIAIGAGLAVIGIVFLGILSSSVLQRRLVWSAGIVSGRISGEQFMNQRLSLWAAAGWMIRDFPIAGVGVGAYIIELPNYFQAHGLPRWGTDSAQNLFLHVGAEMGLIGLGVLLWIFFEFWKTGRRGWRTVRGRPQERSIFLGAAGAAAAFFVGFMFQTSMGSFEAAAMFALILFLLRPAAPIAENPGRRIGSPMGAVIAGLLIAGYAGSFLWTSTHALTVEARSRAIGWTQNFGLYDIETDPQGRPFRWARVSAGMDIENRGPFLILPLMAAHPDIHSRPVVVRIYETDRRYRPSSLLREITLMDNLWTEAVCKISPTAGPTVSLLIETNRSWQPWTSLGLPDRRNLAVALGKPRFSSEPGAAPGRK